MLMKDQTGNGPEMLVYMVSVWASVRAEKQVMPGTYIMLSGVHISYHQSYILFAWVLLCVD